MLTVNQLIPRGRVLEGDLLGVCISIGIFSTRQSPKSTHVTKCDPLSVLNSPKNDAIKQQNEGNVHTESIRKNPQR